VLVYALLSKTTLLRKLVQHQICRWMLLCVLSTGTLDAKLQLRRFMEARDVLVCHARILAPLGLSFRSYTLGAHHHTHVTIMQCGQHYYPQLVGSSKRVKGGLHFALQIFYRNHPSMSAGGKEMLRLHVSGLLVCMAFESL
jgi:hypothetical protein